MHHKKPDMKPDMKNDKKTTGTSLTFRNRISALFFLAVALYETHKLLGGKYHGWGVGLQVVFIMALLAFSAGQLSARNNAAANRVLDGKRYQALASVLVPTSIVLLGTLLLVWPEYGPFADTDAVSGAIDTLNLFWGTVLLFGGVAYAVYELYGIFTRYHFVALAGGMAFGAFVGVALTDGLSLGRYVWISELVMVMCAIIGGMLAVTLVIAPRHAKPGTVKAGSKDKLAR